MPEVNRFSGMYAGIFITFVQQPYNPFPYEFFDLVIRTGGGSL